ncbi:monofunctional biosynthetic peptidoglycan transglycosylase [Rosettibacter firmus]|uniref:monofunctional biosynthetic peptidoglycan transglycosylase n=1 Tax=Rosettibacter firmus TaxID=3111522 RepID=UPI00336C2486
MVKIFKVLFRTFIVFNLWVIFLLLFFRVVNPASTAFIYTNTTDNFKSLIDNDVKYKPISINKVSLYVPLAVIASEDQRFFEHFGFDFEQIEKAIKENEHRKRIRGASTITMQVAKNLFLFPSKIFFRKALEAYYTVLIECLWSKKRIIEVYLNSAEMGKNIYGIYEASKIYYKKAPIKLSKLESATIAAVLPNPKKRNPLKPSSYLLHRRIKIMEQMDLIGGRLYIKKML